MVELVIFMMGRNGGGNVDNAHDGDGMEVQVMLLMEGGSR